MSWNQAHRRHRLVHAVLDEITRTRRPTIPQALQPEVVAEFGGFDGFLVEVQLRWYRTFDTWLDELLEEQPADLRAALVDLWQDTAERMPGAQILLNAHIAHPALAEVHDHHRRRLQAATGIHMDPLRVPRQPTHDRTHDRASFFCLRRFHPRPSAF
ncbi:hypothetical protein ACQEU6_01650 [Spirillospora sp. CA-108201]